MNMDPRGQHLTSPPDTEPEFSTVKDTVNAGVCNLIIGVFLSDTGSSRSESTYQKALEDPSAIGVASPFSQASTEAASAGSSPALMVRIERSLYLKVV